MPPKSKIQQSKDIPINGSTFGEIVGAVLKIKPPVKKATKKKATPKK